MFAFVTSAAYIVCMYCCWACWSSLKWSNQRSHNMFPVARNDWFRPNNSVCSTPCMLCFKGCTTEHSTRKGRALGLVQGGGRIRLLGTCRVFVCWIHRNCKNTMHHMHDDAVMNYRAVVSQIILAGINPSSWGIISGRLMRPIRLSMTWVG